MQTHTKLQLLLYLTTSVDTQFIANQDIITSTVLVLFSWWKWERFWILDWRFFFQSFSTLTESGETPGKEYNIMFVIVIHLPIKQMQHIQKQKDVYYLQHITWQEMHTYS